MENSYLSQEDIQFLGNISVCGSYPNIFPQTGIAQWNIGGLNFDTRCIQLQIIKEDGGDRAILQVQKRGKNGGHSSPYDWTPLAEIRYLKNEDTQRRILREIGRWQGIDTTFKDWIRQYGY